MHRDLTTAERLKVGYYALADVIVAAGLAYVTVETSTPGLWTVVVAFALAGVPLTRAAVSGRGNSIVRFILHETDDWGG